MNKKLDKLFDQYEGNLLNYFCGLTPSQSREFNKMKRDIKDKWFFPLAMYIHVGILGLMKDSTPSLFIKDYMRRLSLKMTDKQYEVLEAWAKSESRTVENMGAMFLGEYVSYYLLDREACVLKIENDRDQSNDNKYQYYKDSELEELYAHLGLQQDRDN